ncbi:MAG: alkaline phosphatase, partial [Draconibacterium sp.]|nr:alkaline phosphatase [Draconibacterium sp.]
MVHKLSILILVFCFGLTTFAQDAYMDASAEEKEKTYSGGEAYDVKTFTQEFKSEKPKNIILLIGDGMGITQVFSGITANKGHLFLENCKHIGFSKTQSADKFITDSAAGGTALSTGTRTYNGAIAVDMDKKPLKTILEAAEENGLATG